MADKDEIQKKIQEVQDQLIEVHKKSGLPGTIVDFRHYQPAIMLCEELIHRVSEFRDYKDFSVVENDGKSDPYLHFGNFGRFLVEEIQKHSGSDIVKRAFEFVNEAYNNTTDENIRTMFGTEVFENLTVSKQTIDIAKKCLEGDALGQFGKTLS